MTLLPIVLILISTIMHAGWNLIARFERSERFFYQKMLTVTLLVGFIPATISELQVRSMTPLAWACVLGSGFSASVYLYFLAKAFESSDFSVVYPVARSLPVLFVAFGDVLRGRILTEIGWLGLLLVAGGCVLVPLQSLKEIALHKYLNKTSLWMLFAAMGTVGYTLLDKIAAEVVQQGADTALRYGYFYFAIQFFPYMAMMHISGAKKQNPKKASWRLAIPAAVLNFAAYWLVLWAYQLSPFASYILAFRQFSIVIGAVLAFILYKEQGIGIRLSGALMITGGLILIALWGW
ncbi:MAG: EamA family transporter [Anaerolineales bacterium]|nr:EamA family transporter [Anaerolineales bacterium]